MRALAHALEVRFGRIVNTTVQAFDAVELDAGDALEAAALPARAELAYTDGSTASRAIAWDAASLAAVDTDVPGTYRSPASWQAPQYATPFADERADPSIFRYDWNGEQKFLMIATEDLYGANIDPQGGAHMPIRDRRPHRGPLGRGVATPAATSRSTFSVAATPTPRGG